MKKKQGVLVLILTVVLIGLLAFTTAVGFGPTGTGSAKNIKTGLDLSGGVSITYQAKGDDPSQEDMDDTVYQQLWISTENCIRISWMAKFFPLTHWIVMVSQQQSARWHSVISWV